MTWAWEYDPNEEWVAEGAAPAFLAAVETKASELVRMAEALYLDGSAHTGGPQPMEQVTAGDGMVVFAIHPRLERVFILRVIPNPSKNSRDDLPQVVVGMAVTRDGIPVRVWSWPGSSTDTNLIRQVKDDLREWSLSRVVWVADRGFTSAANRRALMQGGGGYIIGEKLRSGAPEIKQALSRPGRYATVRDNLQVKEVKIGSDDRFVICFNPEQATRDAAIREQMVAQLEEAITGTDKLKATERAHLAGQLSTKPGLKRYLRITPGGLLRIDKKKITAEANLDGKYLLRSSDPKLSAEDIALGYKSLLEVERGWRDMKQILDLRPVYHRREDRIRAHVLLCWLALLLVRVAENATGQTWNRLRAELQRLQAATFTGPAGTYRQTTEPTKPQRDILVALDIPAPKKVIELATTL